MADDTAVDPVGASLLRPQLAPSLPGSSQIPLQGVVGFTRVFCGYVLDYFARSDCYLVFDPQARSTAICTAMHPYGSTGTAMGARSISGGYPPHTPVYVLEAGGTRVILGVALATTTNLKNLVSDMIVMRSQVGAADPKASMHFDPLNQKEGLSYCDVGRPLDALGGDWGQINELGVAVFLGKLMACLRASDMAKIEAFWGDDLLRVFGYNLQTYTGMREEYEIADEGEGNLVRRTSPFLWEAIGAREVLDSAVEEKKGRSKDPEASAWWEPKKKDQLIIPRHTLLRGYMGDIEHEWVQVPGKNMPDQESFSNFTKYIGVFEQSKGVTGAYFVRSAKEISFEKSILIPVPKELKAPDDATGDNRKNYHAAGSSRLGEKGPLPKLPEYKFPEKEDANGWFSYLYDVQAWMYNRVIIGGLYHHTTDGGGKDWYLPAESELVDEFLDKVKSASIDGSKLNIGNKFMVSLPDLAKLKVDHREGHTAVRYYQSRAIFKIQEDGSILIEDGYGSSIQMKGGSIELSCVGDVFMRPGRNIINWAPRDFIAKAGNCVDITASQKDIHIKAEKNLEFISGNGPDRKGAMIFDCRSLGAPKKNEFTPIGEDRKTSGILFRAEDAPVYMYGNHFYVGLSKQTGRITLDARDNGEVYMRGKEVKSRTDEFNIIERNGSKSLLSINKNMAYWNTDRCHVNGALYVAHGTMLGKHVEVQGFLNCTTGVYAKNGFASEFGGNVGKGPVIPPVLSTPEEVQKVVEKTYKDVKQATDADEEEVVKQTDAPGNMEFKSKIHFSCRRTRQYFGGQESTFFLWETRWQSLLKQGGGSATWKEPEVPRQGGGAAEMPHPGIDAWQNQPKFKFVSDHDNYDAKTGIATKRSSMNEAGKGPQTERLAGAYIVNTQA